MSASSEIPWRPAQRALFRFGTIYIGLYIITGLTSWWETPWTWLVTSVGAAFGLRAGLDLNGSGDTTHHYVSAALAAGAALIAASAWSALAKRRAYDRGLEWLLVVVRHYLAFALVGYGIAKLMGGQFAPPTVERLATPVGELTPMGLAWTFMGHSQVYAGFTGALEVAGAALLLSRRTTSAGALLLAGVMTNVVMMNLCFDIPVKLYALHLLAMCLLVLGPDTRRLTNVLILNRAAPAKTITPSARWASIERIAKVAVMLGIVAQVVRFATYEPPYAGMEETARAGIYRVVEVAGSPSALPSFHTLVIGRFGRVQLRSAVGVEPAYGSLSNGEERISLANTDAPYTCTWGSDGLHLERAGEHLRLEPVPDDRLPLVSRGFHWVNPVPLNR